MVFTSGKRQIVVSNRFFSDQSKWQEPMADNLMVFEIYGFLGCPQSLGARRDGKIAYKLPGHMGSCQDLGQYRPIGDDRVWQLH